MSAKELATSATGLFCIGVLCACDNHDHTPQPTAPVSSVVDEPDWYRGKTVRVAGEVEKVHNPRAFTLEGDAAWWARDITVVTKTPVKFVGMPVGDDDDVMVTGYVVVGVAEVERELGRQLEPSLAQVIAKRPVLIARTIRLVGEYASWSAAEPDPASEPTAMSGSGSSSPLGR